MPFGSSFKQTNAHELSCSMTPNLCTIVQFFGLLPNSRLNYWTSLSWDIQMSQNDQKGTSPPPHTHRWVAYLATCWALLQGEGVREKTEATVNHAKQRTTSVWQRDSRVLKKKQGLGQKNPSTDRKSTAISCYDALVKGTGEVLHQYITSSWD